MSDRKTYIGSSDAKDILEGRWEKVWLRKTGRAQEDDLSRNFKVQLGLHTETFHLDWTLRALAEEGVGFTRLMLTGKDQTFVSVRDADWIGCHPDEIIRLGASDNTPVEVKHSSGQRSMNDLLDYYMPQLQHHMLCTGSESLLFSVIQGNEEPERRWVGASPEWAAHMQSTYAKFWQLVLADTPPPRGANPHDLVTPPPPNHIVPINGMTKRDATGDNLFTALAHQFIETKDAHGQHEAAKKALKAEVAVSESEVFLPGVLSLSRNKAGSIGFKILAATTTAAA